MLEDLAKWIVAGEPEGTDLVAPETLLLNEVAQEAMW